MADPPVDSDLPVSDASFGETREQRAANARSYVRAIRRGFAEVWIEVMAGDADGNLVPHRRRLDLVEAEGRYGEPEWAQARIDDHGRTRVRERGVWRSWRAAEACRRIGRGRAPRPAQNARTRGSRRSGARSSGGGSSGDDDGEAEPPGLRFRRHSQYGPVTPKLYALLESASAGTCSTPGIIAATSAIDIEPGVRVTSSGVELREVGP